MLFNEIKICFLNNFTVRSLQYKEDSHRPGNRYHHCNVSNRCLTVVSYMILSIIYDCHL